MEPTDLHLHDYLQLPTGLGLPALRKSLAAYFTIQAHQPLRETRTFYDTFEWDLWFNNQALYYNGSRQVCARLLQGWTTDEVLAEEAAAAPRERFPAHWSPGPLRNLLHDEVGLRALMPIAEITFSARTIDLMNVDQKVVFRFELISLFDSPRSRTPFFRLCRPKALRGYEDAAVEALAHLKKLGLTQIIKGPLEQCLAQSGRYPAPYTLRPVFGLNPNEPAREAVRDIVRRMLSIARSQEEGIVGNIDTEFLHDYRICIRKIRSVTSLLKGVYPEAETERLKKQWGELARATNHLRDLDVYLLDRESYNPLVPESLQEGLDTFFTDIQAEHAQTQKQVSRHLRSKSYQQKIKALEAFFTEPDTLPATEYSSTGIRTMASGRIYKRYQRIRKAGRAISDSTPDEAVHQVRIQCKKLRYMLEFFGELYDHQELDALVKRLKKAQTSLGRFNDYAVQQQSLLSYWSDHKGRVDADQALSIGGLVAVLNQKQLEERVRAQQALNEFCRPKIHEEFRSVFNAASEDSDT